jgi:hypothetical protein
MSSDSGPMNSALGPEPHVPDSPPPAVLDEIGAAAGRAERLADRDRELHCVRDATTGRMTVQLRDLTSGRVLGNLSPSQMLELLTGPEEGRPSARRR